MRLQPAGPPPWNLDHGDLCVRFLGLGAPPAPSDLKAVLASPPAELSWLQQVHSAQVQVARPGRSGRGDVLVTSETGLALAIATADCLPILLAAQGSIAAAHAGWRGLVAGALPAAVESMASPAEEIQAWIGPSIGPCCYEIGDEVAESLASVSHEGVLVPGKASRSHADLRAVALHQLASCGVTRVQWLDLCTHCESSRLASYRRDGERAGRNWALVWQRDTASAEDYSSDCRAESTQPLRRKPRGSRPGILSWPQAALTSSPRCRRTVVVTPR